MSEHWTRNQGRGNEPMIRAIVWLALRLGRIAIWPLMHLIISYFVFASARTRGASRAYLGRVLGRPPGWRNVYRHHWVFANALLDRVFIVTGRARGLRVTVHGGEVALSRLASPRGCLLLGAHLGSFEALRLLAERRPGLCVRPMMYLDQDQASDRVLRALNPEPWRRVIPIGGHQSLLRARDAIEAGETVAILGDRAGPGARTVPVRFLGGKVALPAGPLVLAHALDVPVVLCFALRRGWGRYEAHFEELTPRLRLPRADREAALRYWAQRYADRLAVYCQGAPYNWFNFYDYWAVPDERATPAARRRPAADADAAGAVPRADG